MLNTANPTETAAGAAFSLLCLVRVAGGTGFRYLLARQMKMYGGLDFAWGPEDFVFYVQVGNAWN